MDCANCGASLRWNPLRGTFDCPSCRNLFHYLAGTLQLVNSPKIEKLQMLNQHNPEV